MTAPSLAATFLVEYLDLPAATGIADARWEVFQLKHLNNLSLFQITRKSRQIGWSWLAAAEAVALGKLEERSNYIFVSINQDEAAEKIRYAKAVIEALDPDQRPRLKIDNAFELEFMNGSRLISHPCRPVRGKAKARVYLDEFAHYAKDREIYQSALPVITKGGAIRIGSTPLGARGMYWEIYAQKLKPYPGYIRQYVPWWKSIALCRDTARAALEAPAMPTEERVRTFGTPRLIEIFENSVLDDFQQEYEAFWIDEAIAWIDWELITRNQALAQAGDLLYYRAKGVEAAMQAIDRLAAEIQAGHVESVLAGGGDIGRRHDTTEFIFLGQGTTAQIPYRLGITLDRVEFEQQAAVLNKAMEVLPVRLMMIDSYGIGMQLVENAMKRWGPKVQPAEFTNPNKSLWAVETKLRFQRGESPIPTDRDLAYQIHSLRKKITESNNVIFDVETTERHHADQFWALALATFATKGASDADDWLKALKSRKAKPT